MSDHDGGARLRCQKADGIGGERLGFAIPPLRHDRAVFAPGEAKCSLGGCRQRLVLAVHQAHRIQDGNGREEPAKSALVEAFDAVRRTGECLDERGPSGPNPGQFIETGFIRVSREAVVHV